MESIWKKHRDLILNGGEDVQAKERFKELLRVCNVGIVESLGDDNEVSRQDLRAFIAMSIQLQTSIAILNKLEAIE